jgi:hypothetical protein
MLEGNLISDNIASIVTELDPSFSLGQREGIIFLY